MKLRDGAKKTIRGRGKSKKITATVEVTEITDLPESKFGEFTKADFEAALSKVSRPVKK